MNATTIKNVLEQCKSVGDRVAVGFAHRSFFVEDIQTIDHGPTDADDTLFTVTALVYDTGHSRQATPRSSTSRPRRSSRWPRPPRPGADA